MIPIVHAGSLIKDFPCTSNWVGPNASNSVSTCNPVDAPGVWADWCRDQVPRVIVPALIGIFAFAAAPIVFIARYCCQCCGGSKMRPGRFCSGDKEWDDKPIEDILEQYSQNDVRCAKGSMIFLLLLGVAFVAVSYAGAIAVGNGFVALFNGWSDLITYFQTIMSKTTIAIRRADGSSPLNSSLFLQLNNTVTDMLRWHDEAQGTRKTGEFVAQLLGYMTGVPFFFLVFGGISAMGNIRSCLPACLALFYFLFALAFGLMSTGFLTLRLPMDLACDQIDAQLNRQPGIVQWWLVPKCRSDNGFFSQPEAALIAAERASATAACAQLTRVCSPNATWAASDANSVFVCSLTRPCLTFRDSQAAVQSLVLKQGVPADTCSPPNCNVRQCADGACSNAVIRANAAEALQSATDATNIQNAYWTYIQPLVDCNTLFDVSVKIVRPFCTSFPKGLSLLGAGCCMVSITVIIAVVVQLRGQKRFFEWHAPAEYVPMSSAPLTKYSRVSAPEEEMREESGAAPSGSRDIANSPTAQSKTGPRGPAHGVLRESMYTMQKSEPDADARLKAQYAVAAAVVNNAQPPQEHIAADATAPPQQRTKVGDVLKDVAEGFML